MKRFTVFAIIALALGVCAQAETVLHWMHIWKDGYSYDYQIEQEIDSVTFSQEVLTLELREDFVTIRIGEQYQLTANVPVEHWASSNESVAIVSQSGQVTAIAEGYAVITATAGGVVKTCIIQVLANDCLTEDGCYVVGDACPIKSIYEQGAMLLQMAQGINEVLMDLDKLSWEESKRDGMWEKYIWLEANKEFELIMKEGNDLTHYGAQLSKQALSTDWEDIIGYKGNIRQKQKMMVSETGLYHIVVDFNKDGALELVGGAQIIIVPVTWSVSGCMNGWGMTEGEVYVKSASEIVWTWEEQVIDNGQYNNFRFRDAMSSWKIRLDDAGVVKAHTNLGENGRNGANDIYAEDRGIYTIKLNYNLAAGDIENSYSYELIKTSDINALDYSDCVLEVVGSAVVNQDGAYPDETWSWGNVFPMGTPSVNGHIYTWEVVVELAAVDGFKVRTKDYQNQGDIPYFDIGMGGGGANAYVEEPGLYVVTAVVDALTGKRSLSATLY